MPLTKDRSTQAALLALLDTIISDPWEFAPLAIASAAEQARNMIVALDSSLTASAERVTELSAALKECDKMAEAGICQFGAGGKHEFLKDVRKAVHSTGLQGGLTEYRR